MISIKSLSHFFPIVFIKNIIFKLWLKDAVFKLERIEKFLSHEHKILEIGAGSGSVCFLLREHGFTVTPLDIVDKTLTDSVIPVLYSGGTMPFQDKSQDTALILTVLHHTSDPEEVLREAIRVADNIVIIEDIYDNKFQQYLTYLFDSIFNLEFIGHPHSNKKDKEWKELFNKLGLTLKDFRHDRFLFFFKQTTYSLSTE